MGEKLDKIWKKFLKKHWQMFAFFIVIAIVAFAGAIYVFLWFVGEAQLTGLVPPLLGGWAMGHFIPFLLHLIFWEFIFIGIPVIIAIVAIYFGWWKKLPDKERKEYRDGHLFGKRSKRSDAGGGFSFLIFIVALIWILIIFGIPMALGGIWWIRHEMKKEP